MPQSSRLATLLAALLVIAGPAATATLDDDLVEMMSWFSGEFDNHLQVLEEKESPPEQPHEWIHSIFQPVTLAAFGEHVFYVEQYLDGDPSKIYRNRLYSFSVNEEVGAIQLTILSFVDSASVVGAHLEPSRLAGLTAADVRTIPGCEVYWKREGDRRFIGWMPDGACRVQSRQTGRTIIIHDDLVLTPDEIWIADRAVDEEGNHVFGNRAGIPHKLKKSYNFDCWAAIRDQDGEGWGTVARGLVLHDQGGRALLTTEGDEPTTYRLELEQRVYAGERQVDVLKLALYRGDEEESLTYTWSEPSSSNIGMNLRWMQAGCTRR